MTDREKILERIRQLRQMTAARGCTEAEALAAAAKAAELMSKIGVTEADVEVEEASSLLNGGQRHTALRYLWGVIAFCTNTAALQSNKGRIDGIIFFGVAPGPQIAVYLRDVLDRAVSRELADFKAGTFYKRRRTTKTRKAACADFLDALVQRLAHRLVQLFNATLSDPTRQLAASTMDRRYKTTSLAIPERQTRFHQAAHEGWRAGGRPTLAHGVGGTDGGPAGLIGRDRVDA